MAPQELSTKLTAKTTCYEFCVDLTRFTINKL